MRVEKRVMKNDELDALLQQRKELNAKIKELLQTTIHVNNTKFERRTYPTGIVEYAASVRTRFDKDGKPHYAAIARQPTKEEAIKELEENIKSLSELLRRVKGEFDAQNSEEKEE